MLVKSDIVNRMPRPEGEMALAKRRLNPSLVVPRIGKIKFPIENVEGTITAIDRQYSATTHQLGPFTVKLCLWEGAPHVSQLIGEGIIECIAAADALSNLPALWSGHLTICGGQWLAEGWDQDMQLTEILPTCE